jgi:hypothetical protein
MKSKTRFLQSQVIVSSIVIHVLAGCSWLIGFDDFIERVGFLSVALACTIAATLFLVWRSGKRRRFGFIIPAAWYGITFAVVSWIGLRIDPQADVLPWKYSLKVASLVGVGSFLFLIVVLPIGFALLRFWRKNVGDLMSPRTGKL